MAEITVTFADGSSQRLPAGVSAREALRAGASRNGAERKRVERAIAARVEADGVRTVELERPLTADCRVSPVAPDSAEVIAFRRLACAHLTAQAVRRLCPDTQSTIGPVIENGFYYDIRRPEGFSPEDLTQIEDTMRAIAKEDLPIVREIVPRAEAIRMF